MIEVCQFGAGRIGAVHATNVARHPALALKYVIDVDSSAASALADEHNAKVSDPTAALSDPSVGAVIIASSTDTHADLIELAAKAEIPIFCEKPIDLSLDRIDACLNTVESVGVPLLIGFNRRYDPNFAAIEKSIREGRIGNLEQVIITSRDPAPPPIEYINRSGGLFRDMMIHDFDMARFLLGEEPVEVFATASCLIDPAIGDAGDVDSAMVVLKSASGTLCQISNSRRAVFGYDQRVEVHGSNGMLQAGNRVQTTVTSADADGIHGDKPLYFFLERYADAYRAELDHFVDVIKNGAVPFCSGADGRQALVLANCAVTSVGEGRSVSVPGRF